jgi:hypothetical protein
MPARRIDAGGPFCVLGNLAVDNDQVGVYVGGYRQLSVHRVGFYPIHLDKSPAVHGKLNKVATVDPIKLRFWAEHCHYRSFAARLLAGCRVVVIDTEDPFKHPDRPGPDGELVLGSLLEDTETILPPCPTVRTASGGFHRYLLVPAGYRIRTAVALWPGIDVLATGSSVILPGSRTEAGDYREVRSFEECPIPEAPRPFVSLIRGLQRETSAGRPRVAPSHPRSELDTSEVSRRQWWLLFRNRVFRSFWHRQGKAGDATDSAYEYHLAKACFCCGLNHRQAEHVILAWRRQHGLQRSLRKLREAIVPKAWAEVEPWVERWHAEREAARQSKDAAKTANLILAQIRDVDVAAAPVAIGVAYRKTVRSSRVMRSRIAGVGSFIGEPVALRHKTHTRSLVYSPEKSQPCARDMIVQRKARPRGWAFFVVPDLARRSRPQLTCIPMTPFSPLHAFDK